MSEGIFDPMIGSYAPAYLVSYITSQNCYLFYQLIGKYFKPRKELTRFILSHLMIIFSPLSGSFGIGHIFPTARISTTAAKQIRQHVFVSFSLLKCKYII